MVYNYMFSKTYQVLYICGFARVKADLWALGWLPNRCLIVLSCCVFVFYTRASLRWGEPTRRGFRERQAAPQRHPAQDSGAGPAWDSTLWHQQAAARLPRLRQQDPGPLQRDRLHPPGSHRRQQAAGHHTHRGQAHKDIQAERPGDFCLGDPGQATRRRGLRQVQSALRELHQSDPPQQDRESLPAEPVRVGQAGASPTATTNDTLQPLILIPDIQSAHSPWHAHPSRTHGHAQDMAFLALCNRYSGDTVNYRATK